MSEWAFTWKDPLKVVNRNLRGLSSCNASTEAVKTLRGLYRQSFLGTSLTVRSVHRVRGQSVLFDLALIDRNMQVEFDLKLSVYSLGVDI